jgi:hypothetical protein
MKKAAQDILPRVLIVFWRFVSFPETFETEEAVLVALRAVTTTRRFQRQSALLGSRSQEDVSPSYVAALMQEWNADMFPRTYLVWSNESA